MIEGYDIVCMSFVAWDDYWGTSQHLMSRLAKHNRVLFVDPAVSPLSAFTRRNGAAFVRSRFERWRSGHREVAPNLFNATPPLALPLRYFSATNAANARLMQRWLLQVTQRLGFKRPLYWNFVPWLTGVGASLQPQLSLYHCVDDFAALPHWWNVAGSIRTRDVRCCVEADLVLCTAETLAQDRLAFNRNVHVVPNGADVRPACGSLGASTTPADIAALPRPVIGFSGIVDFRFDAELVADLARRRPDWSFALAGGSAPADDASSDAAWGELAGLPNVHALGWKPRDELPEYQRAMDVCLIPFRRNQFTRGVLPLKFFEYLAAGRPVVSTNLEELTRFDRDLVRLAGDPSAFHDAIAEALENDSPRLVEKRIAAAHEHSWDKRVELASCLIEGRLADKNDERDTTRLLESRGVL
ncbi:MAG TPA: glycosyltransferase [Dehalococcoidia bacterium]|nr:glycosyltransferase [Dehalococcoidia bacterium]